MTLLAIDTSEQTCSAALMQGADVLVSKAEHIGRGHAERLLPLIDELLLEAQVTYCDLSRIAVTTGPGTFTGLRVGLSVARGIALTASVPCVGLSGLQVLAKQGQQSVVALGVGQIDTNIVHAVITGRGGQAFHQSFQGEDKDGLPVALLPATGLYADEIASRIEGSPGLVVGSGRSVMKEQGFAHVLGGGEGISVDEDIISVAHLGVLAQHLDPAKYQPEPLYLRAADAKKATPLLPVEQIS